MYGTRRKKFTLVPLIALAALSLAVTVPALSASAVHAAAPVRYATVTVRPGDNIWSLAESRTATGGDVQAVVDQIVAANHLAGVSLVPGQHLRIPD
ncbi:MAG TPA: LysM peptidoglycan-binding domain-containing protein [Caballeronia sp.]|jgi:LysM domain|nr:LysM peptidoglycan-binding domain-containing protein [Caballeronia sp.]